MEEPQKPVTEDIISLTLEVITLLTGEDYDVVRRCGGSGAPLPGTPTPGAGSRGHSPVLQMTRRLPTRDLEILEATNKIIHLLTGEVWKFLAAVNNEVTLQEHQRHSDQECSQMEATPDDINKGRSTSPGWTLQGYDPSMPNDEREEGDDCKTFHLELNVIPFINGEQELGEKQKFLQTQPVELKFHPGDHNSHSDQTQPEVYHTKDEPVEEEINSACADLSQYSGGIKEEVCEESLPTGSENKAAHPPVQAGYEDKVSTNLNMQVDDPVSGTNQGRAPKNPSQVTAKAGESKEMRFYLPKPTPQTDKIHKCQKCPRSFSRYYNLVSHQKVHEPAKSFLCAQCGKCYNRKATLEVHLRDHTGEKPFICLECNKAFSAKEKLTRHKRRHTEEKHYWCAVCGMSYRSRYSLKKHQMNHTGEKPYFCDSCGKCFSTSSSLEHHLKVHTLEKPYSCATCGKGFATRSRLGHHRKVHIGEKPTGEKTLSKAEQSADPPPADQQNG